MKGRMLVSLGLGGPLAGLLWLAHAHPLWLLQPRVMVPLFLVMTLAPAVWRLWQSIGGAGKQARWFDRSVR